MKLRILCWKRRLDLKYGARPLRRAIQRYIEDEISDLILRQEVEAGQTIFCKF